MLKYNVFTVKFIKNVLNLLSADLHIWKSVENLVFSFLTMYFLFIFNMYYLLFVISTDWFPYQS